MDVFSALIAAARPYFFQEALRAAHELSLLEALRQPRPVRALDLPGRRLRPLLDVLVLEGVLQRERRGDEAWFCVAGAAPPPPPPGPRAGWGLLASVIRGDAPLEPDEACAGRYQQHLSQVGAAAAEELAGLLSPCFAAGGALLDAGGGLGAYSAALLRRSPAARACLLDRPAVIEQARRRLAPWAQRVELRAGDLLEDDWGSGYEAVLLCNVLHLYDEARCAALLRRAAAALRPGGELLIKDLRVAADRSGPPAGLYFALNMALYTEGGDVYDGQTLRGWLAQAGVVEVREERLQSSPDSLVLRGGPGIERAR